MLLPDLDNPLVIRALVALFLAILFLQSGIDKLVDWTGNRDWLISHFAKSPLARTVVPMLVVITMLEVAAGLLSAVGCLLLLYTHESSVALWGAVTAAVAINALFFGQRVAKDYAGAAVLVPYFLVTLVGIWLFA